jgi:hypothetical protein
MMTNADGDPAADGCISKTVGRCNKSVHSGPALDVHLKE